METPRNLPRQTRPNDQAEIIGITNPTDSPAKNQRPGTETERKRENFTGSEFGNEGNKKGICYPKLVRSRAIMLVYCSRIFLLPQSQTTDVLNVAAEWLTKKTSQQILSAELERDGTRTLLDGSMVECISASDNLATWHGIRYRHPDRTILQRTWSTEIGIYREPELFTCSVLLRTEESSALVDMNVQTTRPLLVREVFKKCAIASETCGGKAKALRLNDADAFLYEVNNPKRTHPIVQVSYTQDQCEIVSPYYLAEMLAGVATVAVIPPDVDTFELERALDRRLSCFGGAVNIIWPQVQTASGMVAPNYRILSHELFDMRARGKTLENVILASICHRMNQSFERDHLTIEKVRAAKHRAALAEARRSAPKDDPETIELYRRVDEDQISQIAAFNASLKERDNTIASLRAELQQEEIANTALKHNLESVSSQVAAEQGLSERDRLAIASAMSDPVTLRNVLEVLSVLYPARLVILDTAWRSADQAKKFNNPRKAFELLNCMCSEYWESLNAGKSNSDARNCFGNSAFSAKESETVENNKKAKSLRTFTYDGKPIEMMMHLKIGVKPSVAETFRAHFHWDAAKKLIVLGHCGKHLDQG